MKFTALSYWNRALLFGAFLFGAVCSYGARSYGAAPSTYADSVDEPVIVLPDDDASALANATEADATESDATVSDVYANKEITPDEAYRILVSGNARHIGDGSDAADKAPRLDAEADQYPVATIVYGSDMKKEPTDLTETTSRNVYLTQVKGGAVSTDDLASIEYGILNLQTPLLVVLGHYPSDEVAAMIDKYDELKTRAQKEVDKALMSKSQDSSVKTSDEMKLYNLIGPAVARAKEAYPDIEGQELANVVSEALAWQSLETILMKSTVAQDLVRSGRLLVVAAIAEDETDKIYWLGEHPLQEDFVKEAPEEIRKANKEESASLVSESELPDALDEAAVQERVLECQENAYYGSVVNEYYVQPVYYVPSWRLFHPRVWVYRPWRGVYVRPFAPWPYWSPWGFPQGVGGLSLVFGSGGIGLVVGYNSYWGGYLPWNPHFRPIDPWWSVDFFLTGAHFRHPEYYALFHGRRADIIVVPHHSRPGWRPGDPRDPFRPFIPGDPFKPGKPGGHSDPFKPSKPGDHFRPGGPFRPDGARDYRPGDVKPGATGDRPGANPRKPGERPNFNPGKPGERANANPGKPGNRPSASPGKPSERSTLNPGKPGEKPSATSGKPSERPSANPGKPSGTRPGLGARSSEPRPSSKPENVGTSRRENRGASGARPSVSPGTTNVRPGANPGGADARRERGTNQRTGGTPTGRAGANFSDAGFRWSSRSNDALPTIRSQSSDVRVSGSGLSDARALGTGVGNRPSNFSRDFGAARGSSFDASASFARRGAGPEGSVRGSLGGVSGGGFNRPSEGRPALGTSGSFAGRPTPGASGSFAGRPSPGAGGSFAGRPSPGAGGGSRGGR